MLSNPELDDIDIQIIRLLQVDPSITHSDIAKQLNRSQPAIGARIKKLNERGILATQIGVDFQMVTELNLVKIELVTKQPEEVLAMSNKCPFIINCLKLSGEYNISLFIACAKLKTVDSIVDCHFRNKDYIQKVKMDLVVGVAKRFILPVDFSTNPTRQDVVVCGENCPYCKDKITQTASKASIV
jgi:Lrp/AsnC family leucine-responsive transcriptional regulator